MQQPFSHMTHPPPPPDQLKRQCVMCVCVCVCNVNLFVLSVLFHITSARLCRQSWRVNASQFIFLYPRNAIWYFCYTSCIVSFSSLFISHVNIFFLLILRLQAAGGRGRGCTVNNFGALLFDGKQSLMMADTSKMPDIDVVTSEKGDFVRC